MLVPRGLGAETLWRKNKQKKANKNIDYMKKVRLTRLIELVKVMTAAGTSKREHWASGVCVAVLEDQYVALLAYKTGRHRSHVILIFRSFSVDSGIRQSNFINCQIIPHEATIFLARCLQPPCEKAVFFLIASCFKPMLSLVGPRRRAKTRQSQWAEPTPGLRVLSPWRGDITKGWLSPKSEASYTEVKDGGFLSVVRQFCHPSHFIS